ncbi:KilA-N domain-containing protein [Nostoc sp.]|uniref:KilA-N domain-containing protein n=1 Tax=Nostoc sp. TaxID=1180 RepID=UPI002FFB7E51
MSQIEQFSDFVRDAQRDDEYINATKWCKHFGSRLDNWKQLPETKAKLEYLKTTQSNVEPWIVERVGKTWVTWVHPIMAVHLASYLDPAFASYVAETFIRYTKADPTLAADIASRQNTVEGLDIINEAVQKQYSLILGRDFTVLPSKIRHQALQDLLDEKSELINALSESNLVSILNKKFGLPCKGLVTIFPCNGGIFELLEDFLREKHPHIYQSVHEQQSLDNMLPGKEVALLSYFIREINDWVREKGGTDCSALR